MIAPLKSNVEEPLQCDLCHKVTSVAVGEHFCLECTLMLKWISNFLGRSEVNPSMRFEDLGVDSFDLVVLVMEFEEVFDLQAKDAIGATVDADALQQQLATVGGLIRYARRAAEE